MHADGVAAGALDARAHVIEAGREVHHLGLARGVADHGLALRERGGHHQVLGPGHGDQVQDQMRALQAIRRGADVAAFDRDLRAHRREALEMQVDGP